MKRVFMLFILMVGVFFASQAESLFKGGYLPGLNNAYTNNSNVGCGDGCVVKKTTARIMFGNTGPCSFGFYYLNAPTILVEDPACAGLSIKYRWDFGYPGSTGTPSSSLFTSHVFPANGTYNVCVTTIVYDAMGNECEVLPDPVCVPVTVTNCSPPPCDPLNCSQIVVQPATANQVTFTFPLENCDECNNPHYKFGWREKNASLSWNYTNFIVNGNSATLTGLLPCKEYEIIIELRCGGEVGTITDSCIFSFLSNCITNCNPGLDCSQILFTRGNSTSFSFTFQPVNCPDCPNPYYNIGWRESGTTTWNYGGTSYFITPATLTTPAIGQGQVFSLAPCKTYDLIIELKCPGSNPYPWQTPTVASCTILSFYSTNCGLVAPDMPFTPALPVQATVYPNPANEEVTFFISSDQDVEGTILIYNNLGALVKQLNVQTNVATEVILQNLEVGMYHYTFRADSDVNLRASGKLVIVK